MNRQGWLVLLVLVAGLGWAQECRLLFQDQGLFLHTAPSLGESFRSSA